MKPFYIFITCFILMIVVQVTKSKLLASLHVGAVMLACGAYGVYLAKSNNSYAIIIIGLVFLTGIACVSSINILMKPTNPKEKDKEKDIDEAYAKDNSIYTSIREYSIIGNKMIDIMRDRWLIRILPANHKVLANYLPATTLVAEGKSDEKFIVIQVEENGADVQFHSIILRINSPMVRDYTEENGITKFSVKWVLCKPNLVLDAIAKHPDSIILAGGRDTGTVVVYTTEYGKANMLFNLKSHNTEYLNPLWRNITADGTNTNGIITVEGGELVGAQGPYFGEIFKMMTRYDPHYVAPSWVDYP